jgi:hypothetical protein
MSATSTSTGVPRPAGLSGGGGRHTRRERAAAIASAATGAILGILPHVLHHAGPLAGAALLAGTGGTVLFGAVWLVAAVPLLLRVHRRCGSWAIPTALLALFAVGFSVSALVIGPAIGGQGSSAAGSGASIESAPGAPAAGTHAAHHQ